MMPAPTRGISLPTGGKVYLVSKYGEQPAYEIMRKQRWTIALASRETGIEYLHLWRAVRGDLRPSLDTRRRLSDLLEVPVERLFTEKALVRPYARTGR